MASSARKFHNDVDDSGRGQSTLQAAVPAKYILDLRQLSIIDAGAESDKIARLEAELSRLRESEARSRTEIADLKQALMVRSQESALSAELGRTKELLRKLQEDYRVALELIVTLGATVAQGGAPASRTPPALPTDTKVEREASGRPPFVGANTMTETFNAHVLGLKPMVEQKRS